MVGFFHLIRFRLSLAVTFSALTGYLINGQVQYHSAFLVIFGVFMLATGASALNQISEKMPDAQMQRTRLRPLPLNKILIPAALIISLVHLCTGLIILSFTGFVAPLLGLVNIILYNLIYTRLKKITALAVIPGAAVGAVPPLIGYFASGGTALQSGILLFSGFMFLWQLPHFWIIIMKYRNDYERAGFKTFPANITERQIKNLIFLWVFFTTTFLLLLGIKDLVFGKQVLALLIPANIVFIIFFYRMLYRSSEQTDLKSAFIMINSFGLLVMLLFIVNAFL